LSTTVELTFFGVQVVGDDDWDLMSWEVIVVGTWSCWVSRLGRDSDYEDGAALLAWRRRKRKKSNEQQRHVLACC
jgi:hypothetical protein